MNHKHIHTRECTRTTPHKIYSLCCFSDSFLLRPYLPVLLSASVDCTSHRCALLAVSWRSWGRTSWISDRILTHLRKTRVTERRKTAMYKCLKNCSVSCRSSSTTAYVTTKRSWGMCVYGTEIMKCELHILEWIARGNLAGNLVDVIANKDSVFLNFWKKFILDWVVLFLDDLNDVSIYEWDVTNICRSQIRG
jgi:hypothetical protein